MYIKVVYKFWFSLLVSFLWAGLSVVLAQNWYHDLVQVFPVWFSVYIIASIAIVPGFITAFFTTSLWIDKRPVRKTSEYNDPVTVIIASYNEKGNIKKTIESLLSQEYNGDIDIIVADDGSTDSTPVLVNWFFGDKVKLLSFKENRGKSEVLNDALNHVKTEIVLTVDADSFLHKKAIANIVSRFKEDPSNTAAVAGTVLVKNSRDSFWTRVQYHDYFYGISATKRIQSLYGATSVAQGAFSLYRTSVLREIGGWKNCVGEDIVLTWTLISKRYRVGHCEDAYCFTVVPETLCALIKQRRRWAMGLFETLWQNPKIWKRPCFFYTTLLFNLSFILVDVAYVFIFIPGLILALTGNFIIVGYLFLFVAFLGSVLNLVMHRIHMKEMRMAQLKGRRSRAAYVFYILFYSLIIQISSVLGYIRILSFQKKTWGTK